MLVLFLSSSMDILDVCGRGLHRQNGHVVGPVEARKSHGLAEYEAGFGNFVLSAFFLFCTARDCALKILFSSSQSLATG